jgi:hypothetical protein
VRVLRKLERNVATFVILATANEVNIFLLSNVANLLQVRSSILLRFSLRSRALKGERRYEKVMFSFSGPSGVLLEEYGCVDLFSTSKSVMAGRLLRHFSEFYPIPTLILSCCTSCD